MRLQKFLLTTKTNTCIYFNLFMSFTLQAVIEQGGLGTGGLNFDCKVRRESIALEDMFISHIGKSHGMPATAAGCAPPPPPPPPHFTATCCVSPSTLQVPWTPLPGHFAAQPDS